ncbi:hypothetical protein BC830DRAFT_1163258 [Chytriomyces sp. MP71]|nr:hypothetical protein BC830DRAFT_1163258 [Chytriomyces sp. MP71]
MPPGMPPGMPMMGMPMPGPTGGGPDWISHTKPDGKVYYYNKVTQQSTWEKPDELKTPLERALAACPWKEYKTEDGRKYYSNTVTRETVWKVPAEYQAIIDTHEIIAPNAQEPSLPLVPVASTVSAAQMNFETKEDAEAAFKEMLEVSGVGLDWTWDQTMRHVINKPMYRSLKTLSERKVAFQSYVDEKRKKLKEAEEEKQNFERESLYGLLGQLGSDLNSLLRYKKFSERFAEDPVFLTIEANRRVQLFEEFMNEFRRKEAEDKRALRKENVERFKHILKTTPSITVTTTWSDAQNLWASHPDFLPPSPNSVNPLHSMEAIDILVTFEDHMKNLESAFYTELDKEKAQERRVERQNRDEFRAILERLIADNVLTMNSKWKEVVPYFREQPTFLTMLGQSGSTPLELFWDTIVALEDKFLPIKREIMDTVRAAGLSVSVQTVFGDFEQDVRRNYRGPRDRIDHYSLKTVFDEQMIKAVNRQKEEEHRRKEKKTKKRMDAFKSMLKHLNPRITSADTWEKVRTLVKGTEEYVDLDEDQRVLVFDKFLRRLKEKEQDSGSSSSEDDDNDRSSKKRKSKSDRDRERDRDRDRDRDHRSRGEDDGKRHKKRRSAKSEDESDRDRVNSVSQGEKEEGEL